MPGKHGRPEAFADTGGSLNAGTAAMGACLVLVISQLKRAERVVRGVYRRQSPRSIPVEVEDDLATDPPWGTRHGTRQLAGLSKGLALACS